MTPNVPHRDLPAGLESLAEIALDLHWTWWHAGDSLWEKLGHEIWARTRNPWLILMSVSDKKLQALASDQDFRRELQSLSDRRKQYLSQQTWYARTHPGAPLRGVAYFSMEFGLAEPLPLYAGGLGVLAGDLLKTASDLGVPLTGVGLFYEQGFFRQVLDASGWQQEYWPSNDPESLPIQPVMHPEGGRLQVSLRLPGRDLLLHVWRANVGRIPLYLLDSNVMLNSAADRGITSRLYESGKEMRLLQELCLGVGGWRALDALGIEIDVCHLNEGHAALVTLERACACVAKTGLSMREARWATRAGNIFTTHTPVAAAFDTFPSDLVEKYASVFQRYFPDGQVPMSQAVALGRAEGQAGDQQLGMAYLAVRTSGWINGVSRLHGAVSRRIFQPLYPHWPEDEVPISHVTNGVHMPSWDSSSSDRLWTEACGQERWREDVRSAPAKLDALSDEALWEMRAVERANLVKQSRLRLVRQLEHRGAKPSAIERAAAVFDSNVLTLGFARRFAEYKRPNLLLRDPQRLMRLLTNPRWPVQILVAGKAHPQDEIGKRLLQSWVEFVREAPARPHAVVLEDYDMELAQEIVQGVDAWINTPRRPWEASGTSGMKVLVNGGINVSVRDGWWAEAYTPEVGWAVGADYDEDPQRDDADAADLYRILEEEVVPTFYQRDSRGIPLAWIARMRASMSRLAPQFSSNRMLCEYVEDYYLPAARSYAERTANGGQVAKSLEAWRARLETYWSQLHFGNLTVERENNSWRFRVHVYLGELSNDEVLVELYAEPPAPSSPPFRGEMVCGAEMVGAMHTYMYELTVPASRPAQHFTPRIIGQHPAARVPLEARFILWQR